MVITIVIIAIVIIISIILVNALGDLADCIKSKKMPAFKLPRKSARKPNPAAEINRALQEANCRAFLAEQEMLSEALRHMNFSQEPENH